MGNLSQIGDPTGRTYGVYALSSPWTDEGINWANQPNWTDYHHAESSVPSGQGGWNGPLIYMNWDLTGMVKDWMSGVPNYGMVVRDTQENASLLYSTQFFTIHQTPNPTYYPTLLVTYVSPLAVVSFGIVLVAEGFLMIILWRTKVKRARH